MSAMGDGGAANDDSLSSGVPEFNSLGSQIDPSESVSAAGWSQGSGWPNAINTDAPVQAVSGVGTNSTNFV